MSSILVAEATSTSTLHVAASDNLPRYYTGRYGDAMVSIGAQDALVYDDAAAKQKIKALNRMSKTNGWKFKAVDYK